MAHKKYTNKNNIVIPSVTTIINKTLGFNKEILIAWTRKMALQGKDPKEVSTDACDTGTLCHKYIECFDTGNEYDKDLETLKTKATFDQIVVAERALNEYKQYMETNKLVSIKSEFAGVNEDYQFGYTIDKIAESVNGIGLYDFKTAKGIYSDHIIQVAAYTKSVELEFGIKYSEIIHIKKEFDEANIDNIITPITIPIELINIGWEVFKKLREIYDTQSTFASFTNQYSTKEGKK